MITWFVKLEFTCILLKFHTRFTRAQERCCRTDVSRIIYCEVSAIYASGRVQKYHHIISACKYTVELMRARMCFDGSIRSFIGSIIIIYSL
jgi:hypothetical protein